MVLRRFFAVLPCSLLVVAACNDAGPPPVAPATMAAAPVTTVVLDAGPAIAVTSDASALPAAPSASPAPSSPAASTDNGPDFFSCTADADCTAVAKVGCCQNGFLEAVNTQSANAYRASFVCGQKRPICPMYRIADKRLPVCGATSHKCEMLQPDKFTCSGGGANVHACATGFQCDSGGHCARTP
jgi:hypothetical protein